jgi:uncharacterized membrane protein
MNFLSASTRLRSLDLMRGVVCVLMAIDHVRVYSGIPAGGPTPGIFFTRWVTHFVAPAFCLLAGASAYLLGRKLRDAGALQRFLVTRGLFLVLLEVTLIRFTWTFHLDYSTFVLAGVIWMLGWCMVLLAAFVRLQPRTVAFLGLAIAAGQQVFALVPRLVPEVARPGFGRFWEFIYSSGMEGMPGMEVLYVIVPWIGVMMAGYGFGRVMEWDDEARRRFCLRVGIGATVLFLVVAGALALPAGGDNAPPFFVRLLNQQKYPASQLFLLMTLGPLIALLPAAERARGWFADAFVVIGRVPLFYYLLHIPAIHLAALAVNVLRAGVTHSGWYDTAPYVGGIPPDERWSLPLLYLVFTIVVAGILYPACRWYAQVKVRRRAWWLQYV